MSSISKSRTNLKSPRFNLSKKDNLARHLFYSNKIISSYAKYSRQFKSSFEWIRKGIVFFVIAIVDAGVVVGGGGGWGAVEVVVVVVILGASSSLLLIIQKSFYFLRDKYATEDTQCFPRPSQCFLSWENGSENFHSKFSEIR